MSKEMLHSLIDILPEDDTETIFNVFVKFVPVDNPAYDELEMIINAKEDIKKNGIVSHSDINWN